MNESSGDRRRVPQTQTFDLRLSFRKWSSNQNHREAFWSTFRDIVSVSDSDWRYEAPAEVLEAEFERQVSSALGRQFSRRFLGRGGPRMMKEGGWGGATAPAAFYTNVKKVSFRCQIAGYSSLNLKVTVSAFQALADLFDHDFESFQVFFEPFVFQSLEAAYNGQLASSLRADVDFPEIFRCDFERASPSTQDAGKVRTVSRNAGSDPRHRAEWLWRLANGSLLVPFVLALLILVLGGLAVVDLHRVYMENLTHLIELVLEQEPDSLQQQPPEELESASTASSQTQADAEPR